MKKSLLWLLIMLLTVSMVATVATFSLAGEQITIKLTSWRTEDIERMNKINAVFMEKNPNIIVEFQPIKDTEYDAQMISSLQTGVGADIIWLRSYDPGEFIYDGGYLSELNDVIPELADFPSAAINAWAKEDGAIYGIPVAGVTHGVFYLGDIFEKYGLEEPATWAEFIDLCQTLKDNGETVFAQGTGDSWPLYEVIFSGLGANFYGGEVSRQALMAGDMRLTDEPFVNAFKAVDELQQFFSRGYEAINYVDMQQLFGTRQAAMYIGGSWEIGIFEDAGLTDLGWFAPPVENVGDTLQYCFHVDMGVGINKDSKNYEAALEYSKWVSTPEFAQLFMIDLPGFYSYTPGEYNLENPVAQKILDAAVDADVTVRTVWEKMSRQYPSGNAMMEEALVKMLTDVLTPEEAAAFVQKALETWYEPFME